MILPTVMPDLKPMAAARSGIPIRVVADAFIPWKWVEFPDPPPPPGILGIPVTLGGAAVDFLIHGDGRLPASDSTQIGSKFRIQAAAEFDLIERPGETFALLARNQTSTCQFRSGSRILRTATDRGTLSSVILANRLSPHCVSVTIKMSGAVPWNIGGPQPAIDFSYSMTLAYDPGRRSVSWSGSAAHDGFPAHEVFIESSGKVCFNKAYIPTFFSPLSTGIARPTISQALQGSGALGGAINPQSWTSSGDFKP
jgi:hypothetical protein